MSQEEKLTVIEGTTLIDGTGHPPLSNALVVVRGKRIDAVGVKGIVKIPPDADRVDGAGKWLLPGLIDLHVHLWNPGFVSHSIRGSQVAYGTILAAANLRSALQAGITTVRDVGSGFHLDLALRTAIERGLMTGPRLFCAGIGLCMTGGHGATDIPDTSHEVDSPAEIRKAIREEAKAGVDLIKLLSSDRTDYPEFTQEEISAGVDEAHRLGLRVAIHAANWVSVRMAAEAGVDTIEHGSHIDEASADLMAEKGIILVPTLWVKHYLATELKKTKDNPSQNALVILGEEQLESSYKWFTRCVEQLPKTIKLVREKGIRIGAGTDCVFSDQPWAMLPEEIEWLTRFGLSNMQAIESATRIGAEALGREAEIGTVETGKSADLILVDRDPLKDISVLKEVSWVMKDGNVISLSDEWRRRPFDLPRANL